MTSRRRHGHRNFTAIELSNHARLLYWSAVAAAAGVDVAEAQLKRTQRLLDDARALREAGMAVNADVFAAEARFSSAEVDIIRTRNEEEQSLARLRSLLGIDAGNELNLNDVENRTGSFVSTCSGRTRTHGAGEPPGAQDHRCPYRWTRRPGAGGQRSPETDGGRIGPVALARPNQRFLPLEDDCQRFVAGRDRGQLAVLRRQPDQGAGGHRARRATGPAA